MLYVILQALDMVVVGYVRDQSNQPISNAVVSFDDHSLGVVSSDDNGQFFRLLSTGKHWIYVNATGYKILVMVCSC